MSEPIPESVPTSASRRSRPPRKKVALTPIGQQSAQVDALFANPDRVGDGIYVGPKPKTLAAPPEIVASVQGSSAGAGSGEFHVYKASRRREYERLRVMDEENRAEEAEKEYQERKEERQRSEETKLSKNRAKREKLKQRQQRKKLGPSSLAHVEDDEKSELAGGAITGRFKRKLDITNAASPGSTSAASPEPGGAQPVDAQASTEDTGITILDDD